MILQPQKRRAIVCGLRSGNDHPTAKMQIRLLHVLAPAVFLILSACAPGLATPAVVRLTVEEHPLQSAPTLDPLRFDPKDGSMDAILSLHSAERSQTFPDNSAFLDGRFTLSADLRGARLMASENYGPGGTIGWVTLARGTQEIYRIDTGMGSPVNSLRGLWTYDDHWVLETALIAAESITGRLTRDGALLNTELGYKEAFGFQLIDGRPFYFFSRDHEIGYSFDRREVSPAYDEIPHYRCCSESVLNPRPSPGMVAFFARRADTWYYVEARAAP
jgi:hypothetical protein